MIRNDNQKLQTGLQTILKGLDCSEKPALTVGWRLLRFTKQDNQKKVGTTQRQEVESIPH